MTKTKGAAAPRVLLAGFEPFENDPVNPAWEIARALDGWACEGAVMQAVQLPCVFGRSIDRLDEALAAGAPPVLVLCIGAAGGRTEISMERAALNVDDARIPDNAGYQPIDIDVVEGGPAPTSPRCRSRPWCATCARPGCRRRCRTRQAPLSATTSSTR